MKKLKVAVPTALLILFLVFFSSFSFGTTESPRATSMEECAVFADMALVAGALSKHKVRRDVVDKILGDIYKISTKAQAKIQKVIVDQAYREPLEVPGEYATRIGNECITTGGFFNSIMGKDI